MLELENSGNVRNIIILLKSKIYVTKVPVMAVNILTQTISFVNIQIFLTHHFYDSVAFIIYTNIHLGKPVGNVCDIHEK